MSLKAPSLRGTFDARSSRDGLEVAVRCVHKTWTDLFGALRSAGFSSLPEVVELGVTEEHLALDPEFFGPLRGQPLHVAVGIQP